jgi:polysaccharide pyruvyl transferase WcaK-like protein
MIHHIYACRSNLGDWLAARGIQSLLPGLSVREHLADTPFVADTARALADLPDEDLVMIGGGGLFMDYFQPFWEAFEPLSRRVSFCIWGAGLCDLKNVASRGNRQLIREIASRSQLCSVRDDLTREWLGSAHVGEPVPCPSINVLAPSSEEQRGLLHVVHYNTVGPEVYDRMCVLLKGFASETGRTYREINNVIPAGAEAALGAGLGAYRNSDLIVSSRLHGCIIALAVGRKVLAVSGDRKIEAFMSLMGLDRWVCRDDGILESLDELAAQKWPSDRLEQAREANRAIANRVILLARSLSPATELDALPS